MPCPFSIQSLPHSGSIASLSHTTSATLPHNYYPILHHNHPTPHQVSHPAPTILQQLSITVPSYATCPILRNLSHPTAPVPSHSNCPIPQLPPHTPPTTAPYTHCPIPSPNPPLPHFKHYPRNTFLWRHPLNKWVKSPYFIPHPRLQLMT